MAETSLKILLDAFVERVADAVAARLATTQEQPAEADELVDEPTMATRANVSAQTLARLRKAGQVPFVQVGRRIAYRPENVFAALARRNGGDA